MRGTLIAVGLAAVLAAGCTGVPTTSTPQIIGPVGGLDSSTPESSKPQPGAGPREIVQGFLAANAAADDHHNAARAFLTTEAKNRWSDKTVTIVDAATIGNYDPSGSTVTVNGKQVGTINAAGIYTPVLRGDGSGGDTLPMVFRLKQVAGEWRIDTLKNGLLLSATTAVSAIRQYPLYYFDLAEKRLVPDPRYSVPSDPLNSDYVANWLMEQLVAGPRPELQNAVSTELPAQTGLAGLRVTTGTLTTVELPGAGQLDPGTRDLLAAQIAYTLVAVTGVQPISITDGGRAVTISAVGGTQFTSSDFASSVEPSNVGPPLYYVNPNGGVSTADGVPLPGGLGGGQYRLTSVALANSHTRDVWVAGTSGPVNSNNQRLLVGTQSRGLHDAGISGRLSRPTWAPNVDEVWVGAGSRIKRVSSVGQPESVPVTPVGGALAGRVAALRFSPDGSRIAMVLAQADGTAQVWSGAVVRNSVHVRVDSLEPITPLGIAVVDVAWNDQLKLFVIGRDIQSNEANYYEVQVDGSQWTPRNITDLPGPPDSITVAQKVGAWVSVGGSVFTQRGRKWANPGNVPTYGTNPVYLE